jgi:transposase
MLHANGQKRPDVVEKRKKWRENQNTLDVNKLVFLDESSITLALTRLYGWGERSARVEDYVPDVRFERTSVISTLRLSGVNAPLSFKGSLNGEVFEYYVSQVLAPTLQAGDVLVLDNLSSHKVKGVLDPIYAKGVSVLFLPVYSPDLNPIELLWSKVKSVLRKLKARTHDELLVALQQALKTVTMSDIKGWFSHDGYRTM